jgi:tyrosyl-tRNA synthetase
LAGRKLIEAYRGKEKAVVTVPLLTDAEGRKMSKSDGTGIPLGTGANDMYGKIMSLPDSFVSNMFIQCTDVDAEFIAAMHTELSQGANPMLYKKQLALDIVSRFYTSEEGVQAQLNFESTVQKDQMPEEIPEWTLSAGLYEIGELLFISGLVDSKSDSKRMVQQGAVVLYDDGTESKITDSHTFVQAKDGLVLRVGKRRYVRLRTS